MLNGSSHQQQQEQHHHPCQAGHSLAAKYTSYPLPSSITNISLHLHHKQNTRESVAPADQPAQYPSQAASITHKSSTHKLYPLPQAASTSSATSSSSFSSPSSGYNSSAADISSSGEATDQSSPRSGVHYYQKNLPQHCCSCSSSAPSPDQCRSSTSSVPSNHSSAVIHHHLKGYTDNPRFVLNTSGGAPDNAPENNRLYSSTVTSDESFVSCTGSITSLPLAKTYPQGPQVLKLGCQSDVPDHVQVRLNDQAISNAQAVGNPFSCSLPAHEYHNSSNNNDSTLHTGLRKAIAPTKYSHPRATREVPAASCSCNVVQTQTSPACSTTMSTIKDSQQLLYHGFLCQAPPSEPDCTRASEATHRSNTPILRKHQETLACRQSTNEPAYSYASSHQPYFHNSNPMKHGQIHTPEEFSNCGSSDPNCKSKQCMSLDAGPMVQDTRNYLTSPSPPCSSCSSSAAANNPNSRAGASSHGTASKKQQYSAAPRSPRSPDALLGGHHHLSDMQTVKAIHPPNGSCTKWNDAEKWLTANNGCRPFSSNTLRLLGKTCNTGTSTSMSPNHIDTQHQQLHQHHQQHQHQNPSSRSSSSSKRFMAKNHQNAKLDARTESSQGRRVADADDDDASSDLHHQRLNPSAGIDNHAGRDLNQRLNLNSTKTSLITGPTSNRQASSKEDDQHASSVPNLLAEDSVAKTHSTCPSQGIQVATLTRSVPIIPPPTSSLVVSLPLRDVSTEMTPIEGSNTTSRYPSKCGSPSRHNTPSRPMRLQQIYGGVGGVDLVELAKCHRAKLEQQVLSGVDGVRVFYRSTSNWSSKEAEEEDLSRSLRHTDIEEDGPSSWEKKNAQFKIERLKREEARIQAWENQKKAKADAQLRKLEAKLEKQRSQMTDKIMSKFIAAQRQAEEMRVQARSQQISSSSKPYKMCHKSHSPISRCVGCFTNSP